MSDTLFLRHYRKTLEIGAFQEERRVSQDISVSITAELADAFDAKDDAVDDIVSYDLLVDAVEIPLSQKRYNLLETLAEDMADYVLAHPKVARVTIEIEKLSRVDGALGIVITRENEGGQNSQINRKSGEHQLVFVYDVTKLTPDFQRQSILFAMEGFAALKNPYDQRILALTLAQKSWEIGKMLEWPVVESQTESEALIARGESFVRAPGAGLFSAKPPLDPFDEEALMRWAVAQILPQTTITVR